MKSVNQCFCAQHIQRRLQALCTITKRETSGRLGLALVSDWILPQSFLHSVVCITVLYRAVRTSSLCVKTKSPFFRLRPFYHHRPVTPPPCSASSHSPLTFSPHVSPPLLSFAWVVLTLPSRLLFYPTSLFLRRPPLLLSLITISRPGFGAIFFFCFVFSPADGL